MPDLPKPPARITPLPSLLDRTPSADRTDPVACERCGSARVYRLHAVWRCVDCGFKTDCCGW